MRRNFPNPLNTAVLHRHSWVKALGDNLSDYALLVGFQLFNLRLYICNEGVDLGEFSFKTLEITVCIFMGGNGK